MVRDLLGGVLGQTGGPHPQDQRDVVRCGVRLVEFRSQLRDVRILPSEDSRSHGELEIEHVGRAGKIPLPHPVHDGDLGAAEGAQPQDEGHDPVAEDCRVYEGGEAVASTPPSLWLWGKWRFW